MVVISAFLQDACAAHTSTLGSTPASGRCDGDLRRNTIHGNYLPNSQTTHEHTVGRLSREICTQPTPTWSSAFLSLSLPARSTRLSFDDTTCNVVSTSESDLNDTRVTWQGFWQTVVVELDLVSAMLGAPVVGKDRTSIRQVPVTCR